MSCEHCWFPALLSGSTAWSLECSKHSAHVRNVAEQRQTSHVSNLYKKRTGLCKLHFSFIIIVNVYTLHVIVA